MCWETARDKLLAFPLSGGRPDQLTTSRDAGTFLGAWHLPSGTYAEAAVSARSPVNSTSASGTVITWSLVLARLAYAPHADEPAKG